MPKKPFVPPIPHIDLPDKETLEKMQNMDKSKIQRVKQAVKPTLDREKKFKRQAKSQWWKTNWIGLVGMIFAILSAITGIISVLLQLNLL